MKTRFSLDEIRQQPELQAKLTGRWIRIWSGLCRMWWTGDGYTRCREKAGIYSCQTALAMTENYGAANQIEFEPVEIDYSI